MNYRFRFDKDDLEMKYSELAARIGPDILHTYVSYIYLQGNEATLAENISERKELYLAVGSRLTRDWTISIYNRQDLTKGGGWNTEVRWPMKTNASKLSAICTATIQPTPKTKTTMNSPFRSI